MLGFSKKPVLMGILNVTPDSFSDNGKYFQIEDAIKHVEELIKNGIDIIDVGGESTRPGAIPVSEEEELRRVIPVIKELNVKLKPFLISIDTYKSNVARLALEAGANMINDVSGLTMDPDMVQVAAKANCSIVIMHNKGIPATKPDTVSRHCEEQSDEAISKTFGRLPRRHFVPPRNDAKSEVITEIYTWFKTQTDYAIAHGVKKENIIIDPGIGFGKTSEEDLYLIEHLYEFKLLGFPILVGSSRKSFIKKLWGDKNLETKNKEIIELAVRNGANIIRLHELSYN